MKDNKIKKKNYFSKKIREEKGSITVFILSTMLVIVAVIFTIYFSKMNKISSQEEALDKMQEEYNQNTDDMKQIYEESIN